MQDRVIFIRSVVQFMATKAQIKLHAKKLYQADGYAVKEIIKVASVLYGAMKTNRINSSGDGDDSGRGSGAGGIGEEDSSALPTFDIGSKLSELKQTRQLGSQVNEIVFVFSGKVLRNCVSSSQITLKGATLYDLLGREVELRERRSNVLARQLEIVEVETALKQSLRSVEEEIKKTNHNIENVASNEANLEAKIEKKRVELERNEKRLQTLKKVKWKSISSFANLQVGIFFFLGPPCVHGRVREIGS